jgi:hypothetical protein
MGKNQRSSYLAYLVRCWKEENITLSGKDEWRFSLDQVFDERRRRGFISLKALFDFLQTELERSKDTTLQNDQDNVPNDTKT